MPVKKGGNNAAIIGYCSPKTQNGVPTAIVNNKYGSLPICFPQGNIINQGTTNRCVLFGYLILASNIRYNAISISAVEGSQTRLSYLLSSSNQSDFSIGVKVSLHQELSQGSSFPYHSTDPCPKGTNFSCLRQFIIPPKLLPLYKLPIPSPVISVPEI